MAANFFFPQVVQGMVFKRQVEGDITKVDNAKVAVYTSAVDIMQTETKGTVLIKSAAELMNFSRGEESLLESQVKAIADTGANVVVSGGKFGDMALYFLNKYNLMAVRIPSKFDLRRLCKTVGATALTKLVSISGILKTCKTKKLMLVNFVLFMHSMYYFCLGASKQRRTRHGGFGSRGGTR